MLERRGAPLAACAVVAGLGAATYSVVRYRPSIVLAYTVLALLLAVALSRRTPRAVLDRWTPAAGLIAAAAATWAVPTFTYLTPADAARVRLVLVVATIGAAVLVLLPWRRGGDAALAVALVGYLTASALLILGDPAPAIDVWYTLQGAADSLGEGRNIYRDVWAGPPGVMAAFTYLPWTALLLAPARWLTGDVRVGLVILTILAALAVRALAGRDSSGTEPARVTAGVAALLVLLPGTATQVEQAWTEPMLFTCLAGAALALTRKRYATAVVLLAAGLACKQHLALVLPLLAAWPRFGVRRTVFTALTAGVAVSPWLIADPRAMIDDTVLLLVRYPPMRFADSLYLLAINETGWTPPFWLTGAITVATVAAVCLVIRRRDPAPAELLGWAALVLLVANLVNKQAFYNQYWLVGALVLLALAAAAGPAATRSEQPQTRTAEMS